jgi:hypothetical protein
MTRGLRCSELEKRRDAKAEELVQLQADKDLTDRAFGIEIEIAKLKEARKALGAAPEHVDAETERFVGFLALLGIVSPNHAKVLSENKPVIDAICMELEAFIGAPSLIIGIFVLFGKLPADQREMHRRLIEVTEAVMQERANGITLASAPPVPIAANGNESISEEIAADTPAAVLGIEGEELPAFAHAPETVAEATAAALLKADPHRKPERKARKRKAASRDSVRLWHKEMVIKRPGCATDSTRFRSSYEAWCEDMNVTPVNPTVFGIVLRDEFGIDKKGKGRVKYLDIDLRPGSLRVVARA